ncbi:cyclin-domain-containing protein [Cantharellus anzutake]|uniref:cyclin-domain-containing protein n=1 Tax=Cantharellus anzutake TaxID=1750568 RepID=UPI001908A6B4|nr:cyclin-domain-containing protein [Cantharellus anzutake]KAF8324462.1 cyclin-domain-containing protein [Cantharellus anzutake]
MLALATASQPFYSRQLSQSWQPRKDKEMRSGLSTSRPNLFVKTASASHTPPPKSSSSFRKIRHTPSHSQPSIHESPVTASAPRTPAGAPSNHHSLPPRPSIPNPPVTTQTNTPPASPPHLDIATYPSTELLKLLAALLQQIASANDTLRNTNNDPPHNSLSIVLEGRPHGSPSSPSGHVVVPMPPEPSAFHARNIPTISIESYLLRILKYCPTTNEVFLSLLVYFDRMSRSSSSTSGAPSFAIDSYNVHRLIIAGVTVASKFFSDIFYLNSRYARVGGLPQSELNRLELQFLLLNEFRLLITPEEMQRYANQLLLYSTTLHPQPPSLSLPPPIAVPESRISAPERSLPTPNPSPSTNGAPGRELVSTTPSQQELYDESSEGGYGTTDDEPTIRPDDSSGSSIRTVSSTATSQATTPAMSPARRASRISVASRGSGISSSAQDDLAQIGGDDDDADTDGEGEDTDDEHVYCTTSPSARIRQLHRNIPRQPEDSQMSSP